MGQSVVTQHQVSMSEWFAAIGEAEESTAFREEDNRKAERLGVLQDVIGLPYRRPVVLPAKDLKDRTPEVERLLEERGDESCAFRLTSDDPSLPKLRSRGLTVSECYETWFLKQEIDFDRYTVSIFPNEEVIDWSTIFVVAEEAVFGEIVRGKHSQLSQGENEHPVLQFRYDFTQWWWSGEDAAARAEIEQVLEAVKIDDPAKQDELAKRLDARFSHGYLIGYFESTAPAGEREFFIDYNRVLPRYVPVPAVPGASSAQLRGVVASPGRAEGPAAVVDGDRISEADMPEGGVLVCEVTDVRYLPLMRKAAAIVTQRGGMLSHAAIIARELKVPCVVGVPGITRAVREGQRVTLDGEGGVHLES